MQPTRPSFALTSLRAPAVALTLAVAVFGAGLASTLVAPGVAHAQNKRQLAKKAFRSAKKAFAAGEFDKAVELFKEAYGHEPRPELLFNIGQALKEANKPIEAADYLQRYLQEKPDAPNRDQVAEQVFTLQQMIAAQASSVMVQGSAEGQMVFVDDETESRCVTPCLLTLSPVDHTIKVTGDGGNEDVQTVTPEAGSEMTLQFSPSAPAGAMGKLNVKTGLDRGALYLDGRQFATFPMAGPLDLEVGAYPAAIRIDGETVWSGGVEVVQDETTELDLILVQTESRAQEPSGGAGTMTLVGWSLGGLGIAALGAGAFFGLSASEIESDLDSQLSAGAVPNTDLIDQGESQALYANIFYGLGVVAVGTGVALWLLDSGGGETDAASQSEAEALGGLRLIAAPNAGGGVVGVGMDY